MHRSIVRFGGVTKGYFQLVGSPISVFENFSLEIGGAEITGILGPTGCGKTTLLNLINGLVAPDAGSIEFPFNRTPPRIGTVLQKDLLLPWRNVEQNAVLGVEVSDGVMSNARAADVLREFGLTGAEKQYPDQLSGGMRKKVSLVRTLLFEPDLVLFDEPFANIDYYQKLELESFCTRWIRQRGRASIFVTHDIEEAIAVADRIVVLSEKPARVVLDFPLELTRESFPDSITARRVPQFRAYFEKVWEALKRNG